MFRFQVDLRGLIALLSDHLYSGPEVFVRELLQNSVDAITARRKVAPGHDGTIDVTIDGKVIVVRDDGVGLTEGEVHELLATIGKSSKAEILDRNDYIGRFGIGVLSAFLVADEIVIVTRSLHAPRAAVTWRAFHDGTYTLELTESDGEPGTAVRLALRDDAHRFAELRLLEHHLRQYGALLPYRVSLHGTSINVTPPWREAEPSDHDLLSFGRDLLGGNLLDVVPLHLPKLGIRGAAYVSAAPSQGATRGSHRIYLRSMFLSERGEIFPDWAFFVRGILEADHLRPNAARDALQEGEDLEAAREAIGDEIRGWLVRLAQTQPRRLAEVMRVHELAIAALCVHDAEARSTLAPLLTFETSLGAMTLHECLERGEVRYVSRVTDFRHVAGIAAARGMLVINAGYVYLTEVLEQLGATARSARVVRLDTADVAHALDDVSLSERELAVPFLSVANRSLAQFRCAAVLKRFEPATVPALYASDAESERRTAAERAAAIAPAAFAGLLDDLYADDAPLRGPEIFFNLANPVVLELLAIARSGDPALPLVIETLYVQALLMAQQPLGTRELQALNRGLAGLVSRFTHPPQPNTKLLS